MLKDKSIQSVIADGCMKEDFFTSTIVNADNVSMVRDYESKVEVNEVDLDNKGLKPRSARRDVEPIDSAAVSLGLLEADVQKITAALFELVEGDKPWWLENLPSLVSQPLDSLKLHLTPFQDSSLSAWKFSLKDDASYSILDPLEALIWLAGICRLDRVLIGALPREFVDQYELQWKVLALYWV